MVTGPVGVKYSNIRDISFVLLCSPKSPERETAFASWLCFFSQFVAARAQWQHCVTFDDVL